MHVAKGWGWVAGGEKKNPISTRLITICVQLLNALQAELHAPCIVMRSVTEGSSSRETSGESLKVKGMQRVSATAHCDRKLPTLENTSLSAHTHTRVHKADSASQGMSTSKRALCQLVDKGELKLGHKCSKETFFFVFF